MGKKTKAQLIAELKDQAEVTQNVWGVSTDDFFRYKITLDDNIGGEPALDSVRDALVMLDRFIAETMEAVDYFYPAFEDDEFQPGGTAGTSVHDIAKHLRQLSDKMMSLFEKNDYWDVSRCMLFKVRPCTKADLELALSLVKSDEQLRMGQRDTNADTTVDGYVEKLGADEVLKRIKAAEVAK